MCFGSFFSERWQSTLLQIFFFFLRHVIDDIVGPVERSKRNLTSVVHLISHSYKALQNFLVLELVPGTTDMDARPMLC